MPERRSKVYQVEGKKEKEKEANSAACESSFNLYNGLCFCFVFDTEFESFIKTM